MVIAELIGTFILVSVILGTSTPAGASFVGPFKTFIGLYFALQVALPTCGHVNPAVSIAMFIDKQLTLQQFLLIVPAQFCGAFLAAPFIWILNLNYINQGEQYKNQLINVFSPYPPEYYSNWSAMFESFYGTMFFLTGIFAVTDKRNTYVPTYLLRIAIPLLLLTVATCFGAQAGGPYNPAADFGPRLWSLIVNGKIAFTEHDGFPYIPIIFPLIGGIAGKFFYQFIALAVRDNQEESQKDQAVNDTEISGSYQPLK